MYRETSPLRSRAHGHASREAVHQRRMQYTGKVPSGKQRGGSARGPTSVWGGNLATQLATGVVGRGMVRWVANGR